MEDNSPHLVLITYEIFIPHAHSLKQKRSVTRSIVDRIRSRFNASVAEIAYQEQWQRCQLGVAMIGSSKHELEKRADRLYQLILDTADAELGNVNVEWI